MNTARPLKSWLCMLCSQADHTQIMCVTSRNVRQGYTQILNAAYSFFFSGTNKHQIRCYTEHLLKTESNTALFWVSLIASEVQYAVTHHGVTLRRSEFEKLHTCFRRNYTKAFPITSSNQTQHRFLSKGNKLCVYTTVHASWPLISVVFCFVIFLSLFIVFIFYRLLCL